MPVSVTCSDCGRTYVLKDEFAGRKVRCPDCDTVHVVPTQDVVYASAEPVDEETGEVAAFHPAFQRDKFLMRQKMMAISAKYTISDEAKRPILYVERPAHLKRQLLAGCGTVVVILVSLAAAALAGIGAAAIVGNDNVGVAVGLIGLFATIAAAIVAAIRFSPKRHIHFYADEEKTEPLLDVLQDKKNELLTTTYTVIRPDGRVLAHISKNQFSNFFRKKWSVVDAEGLPLFIAREDSLILSLIRRFVPVLQDLMRTNFVFVLPSEAEDGGELIRGEFNRKFTLVDSYVLDLSRDRPPRIDRRVAVAMGVLLDTGERR
jgi:uncharacterized protein YxjI